MNRLNEVLQGREDNYMLPFFWQHGEDEETLRKYMHVIHDANIGAVCIESRPHPDFCGDKWWTDMDIILEEAENLGMKVWVLDDSHFPTGFANGAVANAPKELHHQYIAYRTLEMAGPVKSASFSVKEYMKPAPLPPWIPAPLKSDDPFEDDRLMRICACKILEEEVIGTPIDLTDKVQGDSITFDLDEGYYRIYVTYVTRNAKGRNDYINFMDKESCRLLIDAVYEPHFAHYRKYFGNVIAGFFSDEPPVGNVEGYMPIGPIGTVGQSLSWSREAEERMNEEYGSGEWKNDIPYLWAAGADKEKQAKIRNAYMDMVTKLVAECFSNQNGQWCEEHGVQYIGHMLEDCDLNMNLGGSMGHFFRGLSGQHWAGVDNIGGQVTINGQNVPRHDQPVCRDEAGFYQYVDGKLGASHAAIDPKKRGICMCENFGAYGWQSGTKEQKFMMDHFMVRGVNRFVPHAFSPKAFPDPDCPPHFYAQGENPLYRAFGKLMAYSNRVCHLIDGGKAVPDVALLYSAESVWAGNQASNIPAARYLAQSQVDFHIIPADVFADNEEYPCSFDGKKFMVNGVAYGALVISGCEFLEVHAAAFVTDVIKKNFPVVFTDVRPQGIIGKSAEENQKFASEISGCIVVPAKEVGKYFLKYKKEHTGFELQTMVSPENNRLTTYHYRTDADTFLVLNEMSQSVFDGELIFQAAGVPVRYNPWENRKEAVVYEKVNDCTVKVSAKIDPLELCIICFEKSMPEASEVITYTKEGTSILEFAVTAVDSKEYLQQLEAAGKSINEEVCSVQGEAEKTEKVHAPFEGMQKTYPKFSGYYIYETNLRLAEDTAYQLVLDEVNECAEVFLNGRSLGMKLQAPFAFEIPAELVKTENELRIEVATLNERKVKALGADISCMSIERPLSATGLVGNVTIYQRMEFYTSEKINDNLTCIRCQSGELLYLLEGEDQCALIDTGFGVCHLCDYIKTLTDKPVTAYLTHGHIDHAMGAPEFNEVYLNKKELSLYRSQCDVEGRVGYAHGALGTAADQLQLSDYTPAEPEKSFYDLEDGMSFDISPFHLDAYALQGHTKGSMIFLIREMRILITGDACNNATFVFDEGSLPLIEYKKELMVIRDELKGKYDRVFLSHHVMDADVALLDQVLEVCDEALAGEADDLPFEFMGMKACIAKKCNERFEREDGKFGNIIYDKNKLY